MKEDLHKVTTKVGDMEIKIDEMENKVMKIHYTCLDIDARSRRQNIVIHGLDEVDGKDTWDIFQSFVSKELDMQTDGLYIHRVERFGKIRNQQGRPVRPRPIIVTFSSDRHQEMILQRAREKLNGSRYRISRDYPEEIRDARRQLIQNTTHNAAAAQNVAAQNSAGQNSASHNA